MSDTLYAIIMIICAIPILISIVVFFVVMIWSAVDESINAGTPEEGGGGWHWWMGNGL